MVRRLFASMLVLALFTGVAVTVNHDTAYAQEKKKSEEGKKEEGKKEEGFKDQWPKITGGQVVKIVKVDTEKMTADVENATGKKMSIAIKEETKFVGPRGGKSDDGIKDDRFVAGYTVKVLLDSTGKSAKEVHLALRKSDDTKKEDPKKKDDTKKEDPKKKDDTKKKDEKKDDTKKKDEKKTDDPKKKEDKKDDK